MVVVPLPTIGRHVRQRGAGSYLAAGARDGAKERLGMPEGARASEGYGTGGAKQAVRETQAREAYEVTERLEAGRAYLLLDDVWTTGGEYAGGGRGDEGGGSDEADGGGAGDGETKSGGGGWG